MLPRSHELFHIGSYCCQEKDSMIFGFLLEIFPNISTISHHHSYNTFPHHLESYPIIGIPTRKGKAKYTHPFITDNMQFETIEPSSTTLSSSSLSLCYFVALYPLILTYFESSRVSKFYTCLI